MNQRKKLKRLCRYITRPVIASKWLTRNAAGQVVLTLKTHQDTENSTDHHLL
jgi:hypothetical protein